MIIIIRGHIRNSFNDNQLYNLLKYLSINYDIDIYIHTWSIKQNNLSWRNLENDFTIIDENYIYNYFKDLFKFIKKIIIDDENNIKLNGNIGGKMLSSKTYLLGWKRYIYGKYSIINYLNNFIDKNNFVLNIRFDLFNNSYVFPLDEIINFININYKYDFNKNIFLRVGEYCGIDNVYIGNISTNYKLISYIHFNLDAILKYEENKNLIHPEFIVSRINSKIFL